MSTAANILRWYKLSYRCSNPFRSNLSRFFFVTFPFLDLRSPPKKCGIQKRMNMDLISAGHQMRTNSRLVVSARNSENTCSVDESDAHNSIHSTSEFRE